MSSAAPGEENEIVGDKITLPEWATRKGLTPESVRNHWTVRDDFPAPVGSRRRDGSGTLFEEYDSAELDAFLGRWEAQHRPRQFVLPPDGDPDEFRTLGAIAKLLGVDGKTVSQYRSAMDERAQFTDHGRRRFYRTADVVAVLNSRRGGGRALDPDQDRRRR